MEDLLKLAVNYGLGIFFAVGIAVAFFLYARDKDRQSYSRELALMKFMEEHSLKTQGLVEDSIAKQQEVWRFQRQEHEAMMASISLCKDSLNSLNNNIINSGLSFSVQRSKKELQ